MVGNEYQTSHLGRRGGQLSFSLLSKQVRASLPFVQASKSILNEGAQSTPNSHPLQKATPIDPTFHPTISTFAVSDVPPLDIRYTLNCWIQLPHSCGRG
ncbi:hypothetical protein J6590_062665 [Homalodisca vitripennis]|nr:hypothetical protein J6590_062665 [Homalodisca vitripennis]